MLARLMGSAKEQAVHPMAFVFPRRDPDALFFPTVHVHDGEVHETASFDHVLFCQPGPAIAQGLDWERSEGLLGAAMKVAKAADRIVPHAECFREVRCGELPNRDQDLRP